MACKTKQIMTGHLTYSLMKLQSAKLWLNAEEHTTFMLFIFIRQKYYELYARVFAKLFQTIVSVVLVVIFWMSFNFYIFILILEVIFHLHSSFYLNLFLFRF